MARGQARNSKKRRRGGVKRRVSKMTDKGLEYLERQLDSAMASEGNTQEVIRILKALRDLTKDSGGSKQSGPDDAARERRAGFSFGSLAAEEEHGAQA